MTIEIKTLNEVCEFIMGQAPPSSTYNDDGKGSLFVRAGDFGSLYPSSTKYTTQPLKFSKTSDVLLCVVGATSGKVNLGIDAAITRSIFALRPKSNILQKYLYYYLKNNYEKLNNAKSGSAQGILNGDILSKIKIPVPPLPIQKQIVSILERAERLKEKRQKANEETNKIIQNIFYKTFGDPQTNPKNWEISTLLEVSDGKPQYGSGAKAISYNGETRYIRITDVDDDGSLRGEFVSPSEIEEKYLLKKGDLLFARSGATVGKTYLHKENNTNSIYAGYMIRFRFEKEICNPDFIFALTKTDYYKKWILATQTQVAQPNINAQQYGTLKIIRPPIDLQNQFAEIVKKIETLKEKQKQSTEDINTLFDALMQKAFKGELVE